LRIKRTIRIKRPAKILLRAALRYRARISEGCCRWRRSNEEMIGKRFARNQVSGLRFRAVLAQKHDGTVTYG